MQYPTRQAAADAAGIDVKTLRGYLGEEEFAQEYKKAFAALVEDATRAAQQALMPAIETLRDICEDEDELPTNRIAAARVILGNSLKLTETTDILARLTALENMGTEEKEF